MILMNYVKLVAGVPTRMHFTDDYIIKRTIEDPDTHAEKPITSLTFYCDEVNGEPSTKTFNIISQKLAAHFEPYRKGKEYRKYDFIVTEIGSGFTKDWNVQPVLRPKT